MSIWITTINRPKFIYINLCLLWLVFVKAKHKDTTPHPASRCNATPSLQSKWIYSCTLYICYFKLDICEEMSCASKLTSMLKKRMTWLLKLDNWVEISFKSKSHFNRKLIPPTFFQIRFAVIYHNFASFQASFVMNLGRWTPTSWRPQTTPIGGGEKPKGPWTPAAVHLVWEQSWTNPWDRDDLAPED